MGQHHTDQLHQRLSLVLTVELIESLEAMSVDDVLKPSVEVIPDARFHVKDKALAVLPGVRMPHGQPLDIGISRVGEVSPCLSHPIGQQQVVG